MLSDSLDPDQDLQSGSKLFTLYDVCCNIKMGGRDFVRGDCKLFTWNDVCCNIGGGGGGGGRGGDYVLLVKFNGGDYVLVVKFTGGDYVLVVKFMGEILSTYTKMRRGGFVRGGLCPYPHKTDC